MSAYQYTAVDNHGKTVKGLLEADSERHVRQLLREKQLIAMTVQLAQQSLRQSFSFGGPGLKPMDRALVTRQLATLLAAGLPIEQALAGVAKQNKKPVIKSLMLGVRAKVLEGQSLSAALGCFPTAFPEIYTATIAAGEKAGKLDKILLSLAEYSEKQYYMRRKIQQALIYPTIMTLVSIAIVAFLLTSVVPKMVSVFANTGAALPYVTVLLLSISKAVQDYGLYALLGALIAFVIFKLSLRQESKRTRWHGFLLKLPLIRYIMLTVNAARFSRTFGILTAASVPVLEAMRVSGQVVTLLPMRYAITAATDKVREGVSIHHALSQTDYFQPMSLQMISVGESSGELENMLQHVADYQDKEVENLLSSLLTLFEPFLILVMGAVVLFIVLAILLPIFDLEQFVGA